MRRRVTPALLLVASLFGLPGTAAAQRGAVSSIVMDAGTGRVLAADNADRVRAPASLTKMMTLAIVFDELRAGRLRMTDRVVMSRRAAGQQPSRLGLSPGGSISVREAIRAVAVISANDVAVALAEKVSKSELAFTRRMNARAKELGMASTSFGNASGLDDSRNESTARDMAVLGRALANRYAAYYANFAARSIRWGGRTRPTHNHLLGRVSGADGIKTGYTSRAGFNLAASAKRGAWRVIVVVLGERSVSDRDVLVANLIELGFSEQRVTHLPRKKAR